MRISEEKKDAKNGKPRLPTRPREDFLRDLRSLSGRETINLVLEQDRPRELVRRLSPEDFFWLVKKAGDEDCLPLLELASDEQWQYLLDLEIWKRDRLSLDRNIQWITRLLEADPKRLARWMFSHGESMAFFLVFKEVQVKVRQEDDPAEAGNGFFTSDGVFYVRVRRERHGQVVRELLRVMAHQDHLRYQALLAGASSVLPAELEEEMYRLRNVRLAERGFLPFEEAVSIYAPLESSGLKPTYSVQREFPGPTDEGATSSAPLLPFFQADENSLLMKLAETMKDHDFLDRIRLEFAGLCNQVLSADGVRINELEDLVDTCKKAAGYVNVALEQLCGEDVSLAGEVLKEHSLKLVFRAGFTMALKVKWEAERWVKESWFARQDLGFEFWGDEWGGVLEGLTGGKPVFYEGSAGDQTFKHFERLAELRRCKMALKRLRVLDGLLAVLWESYKEDFKMLKAPGSDFAFYPMLFNLWARTLLNLEPGLGGVSIEEAREFFRVLREKDAGLPYQMTGYKTGFVNDLAGCARQIDPQDRAELEDALLVIWEGFREDYQWVPTESIDPRFGEFISISPSR